MKTAQAILIALAIVGALAIVVVVIAVVGNLYAGAAWYKALTDWNTVLAAALTVAGLGAAVILGGAQVRGQIEANAEAARKQHHREQTTEALRVAATLAGEISTAIASIDIQIKVAESTFIDDEVRGDAQLFSFALAAARRNIRRLQFFESAGDRIGLLGATTVETVTAFHSWFEDFRGSYLEEWVEDVKEYNSALVSQGIDTYLRSSRTLKTKGEIAYKALKARIAELEAERTAL